MAITKYLKSKYESLSSLKYLKIAFDSFLIISVFAFFSYVINQQRVDAPITVLKPSEKVVEYSGLSINSHKLPCGKGVYVDGLSLKSLPEKSVYNLRARKTEKDNLSEVVVSFSQGGKYLGSHTLSFSGAESSSTKEITFGGNITLDTVVATYNDSTKCVLGFK